MKKNILVFPCGSEIGLEILRSLKYSIHYNVIGASSVDDHGRFVFENYIGNLPFINSPDLIPSLKVIIDKYDIDAVYPTMDKVIAILKSKEEELGCKVISSDKSTVEICLSKKSTYNFFKDKVRVPIIFENNEIKTFPIFAKPNIGYGSRNTKIIYDRLSFEEYSQKNADSIFCEYLSGEEYTVDCFTDRHKKLRFSAPRLRKRIMNGISVNTIPIKKSKEIEDIIIKINSAISFRGAWFVQLKRDSNGNLCLLEIASRLAGSSAIFRNKGINLALLTLFDAFENEIDIIENDYSIELDRALDNKYKIDIDYDDVFVDFDDCILIKEKINTKMISFFYQALNENKKIILLTRHKGEIRSKLKKYKIIELFDTIIQIEDKTPKSNYVKNGKSIFIDDSFAERKEVIISRNIPVFSPDMIDCLIK